VGPAGLVYADVPNRVIAFIIDAIILFVINFIVFAILGAVGLNPWSPNPNPTGIGDLLSYNPVIGLIQAIIGLAVSAGYFIYTWTSMRGTPGQKMLGMQVGNAADGATLTMEQGIRRWIALFAPSVIAQALFPWPLLGTIIGLAAFIWVIALIVTTAQSPTKQGLHDNFAKTIVVKAARTVT
jgi:uncharacterized RDD family membrane protein YckC